MDEFASRRYPIREHMSFQRRSWLVERVGWAVLAAIAAIGLTGAFGTGPLSTARATAGPLTVTYERFQRRTRTVQFVFTVADASAELHLHLGRAFQSEFEFTSIQPAPQHSSIAAEGTDLTFAAQPGKSNHVVIWAHSRHYGTSKLTAAANDNAPASFSIFVYP